MTKLGQIVDLDYPIFISDSASNQSILLEGESGNGKSTAMACIAKGICKAGNRVLAFNVNGALEKVLTDNENFHVVKVKREGIPLPLLECFCFSDVAREDQDDVAEAVAEAFSQVGRMGYLQRYLLEKAVRNAVILRENEGDDMRCLLNAINALEENTGDILVAKYGTLLRRVRFGAEADLWKNGKVTILDFSGYPQSTQILIAQLVLSIIWRKYRFSGQQGQEGVWVVVDEFQNFPLKEDSVLTQILREGRKFRLSLILATQTLSNFDIGQRAILQQPATKLYFKPVESDLKRIANGVPDINPKDARTILQNLHIGECLASGEFMIGKDKQSRTIKIHFTQ